MGMMREERIFWEMDDAGAAGQERGHALVVGGTGMLRGVSLHLAQGGRTVSVVARSRERLRSLAQAPESQGRINPLPLDYRDDAALEAGVRSALTRFGPVDLAVFWIHRTAPRAPATLVHLLSEPGRAWRLFHVRGSAAARPSHRRSPLVDAAVPPCRYRQVILGFVAGDGGSRWLSHDEIAAGVIRAVEEDAEEAVVGRVTPWERRP